jgi:hypothetical protein
MLFAFGVTAAGAVAAFILHVPLRELLIRWAEGGVL